MFSIKELATLYNVSYNTLKHHMQRSGVDFSSRKGRGNKPRIGYMQLLPFFRVYGDRTGHQASRLLPISGQTELFQ